MNNFDPLLHSFLQQHQISFDYYEHIPVFTVEESEQIKHTIPGAHTKNLFLTDKKGGHYLVSISAHKRFPINAFRKYLGAKELSFASAEQLYDKLHLTPGSVSLFGLLYDMPPTIHLYLDHDLRTAPTVGRHPNRNDATIVLTYDMYQKFISATGHTIKQLIFTESEVNT